MTTHPAMRASAGALSVCAALALTFGCATPLPSTPGPDATPPQVRDLVGRSDLAVGASDIEAALRGYRAAIARTPTSVPVHMRYVAVLVSQGRRKEAASEYAARAARPGASLVDRTLAMRLSGPADATALRRVYTLAAQQDARSVWWPLAVAEVEIGEADTWNQKRLEAIARGDRDQEQEAYEQARAALGRGSASLARAAAVGRDVAEVDAYRGFLRATEGDLQSTGIARQAAYGAAEAAFRTAVARDRDLPEAWLGLADVRYRLGDVEEALEAAVEAVRLAPASGHAREILGVILHADERFDEAAAQYREAARLMPFDAEPLLRLGSARADAERWDGALEAWRQALARDPQASEAEYKSGVVLEHLGRRAEARRAFERYLALGGTRTSSVRRRIDRLVQEDQR